MKVFVSYRRKDVGHVAGRLRDRLVDEFGEANVFFDVDSIDPGQRFANVISERLGKAEVVLVLIGPNWQPELLARPDDYVRLELAEALDQKKRVVPVLVDDGALPTIDDLPDELASFLTHNAAKLRQDPDFHEDADRLIDGIKPSSAQTSTKRSMTPRSKTMRLGVAIGAALLLALLVGLAMQSFGGKSDDESSTDESTDIPAELQPELRALVAEWSDYQPIFKVPVACAGGVVEFSAGPAEWRDANRFRIPFAWSATGTDVYSQYKSLDAYDPAGNSWLIDAGIYDKAFEITQYSGGDDAGQGNVTGFVDGLQLDAAGIALVVTPLQNACQKDFILLLVSLDPPG